MKTAYERIADDLLERIRKGEWQQDEQIPTLDELVRQYPESRMTLYKSLRKLTDQGFLSMTRGRGTFVKAAHLRRRVAILSGSDFLKNEYHPFVVHIFSHAYSLFSGHGLDAQLYVEDRMNRNRLPTGLNLELDKKFICAILTIEAQAPAGYMKTREWQNQAVPAVNIGALGGAHRVYVDSNSFISQAVDLCRELGCARAALLEKPEHRIQHINLFESACSSKSISCVTPPPLLPSASLAYEDFGFELMQKYWGQKTRPDVVIIPDDVIAKGVAQAVSAMQLRVPEDIRIIAMTNKGARFFYPVPVLKLEVDLEEMSATAVNMLLDLLNGRNLPEETILLQPKLA